MGKKMKLSSLFNNKETNHYQWRWPSCKQPKTLSFRAEDNMFKSINSIFFYNSNEFNPPEFSYSNYSKTDETVYGPAHSGVSVRGSTFCSSPSDLRHQVSVHGPALEPTSYTSLSDLSHAVSDSDHARGHEPTFYSKSLDFEVELDEELTFDKLKPDSEIETIVCGARSERLFFERAHTSSIFEAAKNGGNSPFKKSVVVDMESEEPYLDFKRSMEDMVESNTELKDWECLEELLGWYLRMNGKMNHGFIVSAFVDLLMEISSSCSESTSFSSIGSSLSRSSHSSFTSPIVHVEIEADKMAIS